MFLKPVNLMDSILTRGSRQEPRPNYGQMSLLVLFFSPPFPDLTFPTTAPCPATLHSPPPPNCDFSKGISAESYADVLLMT